MLLLAPLTWQRRCETSTLTSIKEPNNDWMCLKRVDLSEYFSLEEDEALFRTLFNAVS